MGTLVKTTSGSAAPTLGTLPGDEVRQVMWRYADRFDLQMLVQSARSAARGPVARLVAAGARHSHEWTEEKSRLLSVFDEAGLTSLGADPEHGGLVEGPKNLALALAAFEMAWVDGGAATGGMAGHLALAPIHERGTPEQKALYAARTMPLKPGEERKAWRGAFALTEPLPYVGVDTNTLSGTLAVVAWEPGKEPMLKVEKRGRFITNMGFANFVTAAVASSDPRIKGSCMVILEEGDVGTFDRGVPTKKLVHQLSSTNDPIFSLTVPASRIVGGYTVKDGVIIPNSDHSEVIAAVFRRTRVTVGLMTAAKLLSAVEPVIRYGRGRFRGGEMGTPGTPRFDLGLQQREDVLHRLVDIWATGEAAASMGFTAARLFDEFEQLERRKEALFKERKVTSGRAQYKALKELEPLAIEYVKLAGKPAGERDEARLQALEADPLVQFVVKDALANVLCPATKLWNTGHGANMMREAVSLMGGYGITEDCPGFLGQKWMDAQLEATYEGPEAVQRRQLTATMTSDVFLAQLEQWVVELRSAADRHPGTGACALGSAIELWLWTTRHLLATKDALGKALYHERRQGVTFPLADALCWLVASRLQILDLLVLEEKGQENPALAESLPGTVAFFSDLCHVQAARAAGEVGRICAELVHGYNWHPTWGAGCEACPSDSVDALESLMPGFAACARGLGDVVESDGTHAPKAGPCVKLSGLEGFVRLRGKLDGCLSGSRLAKDRAAHALTQVMIPEALDYPLS
jgi:alkylation response protein AidB-like acyl-CoA dehydrogenase